MPKTDIIATKNLIGKRVTLFGWVHTRRNLGQIIFIDLRDASGRVQVVFVPQELDSDCQKAVEKLRPESVIKVEGVVQKRKSGQANKELETGEIEVAAQKVEILAQAKTPPFEIVSEERQASEELRLKYRYLDLRHERMRKNLVLRYRVIKFIRDWLGKKGFMEVETPLLTKSTPEGARDYVVPSRIEKGKFYALPQSPQQYKQLLQVAGFEKYFQIARCFRDEDPRADRQPECTQLDIEMSFVAQKDILELMEELLTNLIKKLFPQKKITQAPFPKLSYEEAMKKYKSDKPDLRKDKKDSDELSFVFITDFPMFEWHQEEKKWGAAHHPFTKPQTEDVNEIKKQPEKILAWQYDLALNGVEIAGGSIRSTKPEILTAVFEVLGHKKEEIKSQFGHLLEAFEYGVPPHGGIAPGLDRLVMVLAGEPNIREVIAFPKTTDARDLMMGAPAKLSPEQLEELGIKFEK